MVQMCVFVFGLLCFVIVLVRSRLVRPCTPTFPSRIYHVTTLCDISCSYTNRSFLFYWDTGPLCYSICRWDQSNSCKSVDFVSSLLWPAAGMRICLLCILSTWLLSTPSPITIRPWWGERGEEEEDKGRGGASTGLLSCCSSIRKTNCRNVRVSRGKSSRGQ